MSGPHYAMSHLKILILAGVLCLLAGVSSAAVILHAHNDYEHARPLFDALDHGFASVEADVHLAGGQLLVAHDSSQTDPQRTLQSLYLDPLRARARANHGQILSNAPAFYLLIDVKSDAAETWAVLDRVLAEYHDIFTEFKGEAVEKRAVTAIISGNRAPDLMKRQAVRFAALDGRIEDLEGNDPANFIPLISADWKQSFHWLGEGAMPGEEKAKLTAIVDRAHRRKQLVRFWGTPDLPAVWAVLLDAKTDFINADDLAGAAVFVRRAQSR